MATATDEMTPATETERTFASLPLKPLWDLAWHKSGMPAGSNQANASVGFTATMFAEAVGHNVRAVSRWKETGRIPWLSADEAAVALGFHPVLVWGYDWLNVKGDYEKLAAQARRQMERDLTDEITAEGLAD